MAATIQVPTRPAPARVRPRVSWWSIVPTRRPRRARRHGRRDRPDLRSAPVGPRPAEPARWDAGVAGGPAARAATGAVAQPRHQRRDVLAAHRGDVRAVGRRAADVGQPAAARRRGRRRGPARRPVAGTAAAADRRLQLHQLRPHGRPAPPEPLHPHAGDGARIRPRPGRAVVELAPPEIALRAAVHARDLPAGVAARAGRVLGLQDRGRRGEPRRGRAGGPLRRPPRPLAGRRGRRRRPQPGRAHMGHRRPAQRQLHGPVHRRGDRAVAAQPRRLGGGAARRRRARSRSRRCRCCRCS